MIIKNIFESSGGRKFVLALICIVFANIGLYLQLVGEVQYVTLVIALAGMYITGNVVESKAVIKRDYHSASTTPSQPVVVATKEPQQVEEVINPEDIPNEGNLEEVSDNGSHFLTKK